MARLNSAQSSPASTRARPSRATRSGSRDTTNEQAQPPAARRSQRGARQTSVESAASAASRDTRGGRRTRGAAKAAAGEELPTVPEGASVGYINLLEDAEAEAEDAGGTEESILVMEEITVQQQRETHSPGLSTVSDTTARTTHSAQEIAELDVETILDALPDLSDNATKLLDILAPLDASPEAHAAISRDLQIPDSRIAKRLRRVEPLFKSTRDHFGSDHYIDWSIIMRALLGRVPDIKRERGTWRPDGVLQKANLSILVWRILTTHRDRPETTQVLHQLNDIFPLPFTTSFEESPERVMATPGASQFYRTTFELALEIRTQHLISMLTAHQNDANFDPDKVLAYVFFDENVDTNAGLSLLENGNYEDLFKGWDIAGLGGQASSLPKPFVTAIVERCKEIRSFFSDDYQTSQSRQPADFVDLDGLQDKYSWTYFTQAVAEWSRSRVEEVETQLAAQGGVSAITASLTAEIQEPTSQISARTERGASTRRTATEFANPSPDPVPSDTSNVVLGAIEEIRRSSGKSFNSRRNIARLKERERARQTARHAPGQTVAVHQEIAVPDDEEDIVQSPGPPQPSQVALDITAKYRQSQAEKAKENRNPLEPEGVRAPVTKQRSFVDRQPDARRVTPEAGFDASQRSPAPTPSRKRQQAHVDDASDDEEEDFEQDTRPVDAASRRRAAPVAPRRQGPAPTQSSSKRVRVAAPVEEEDDVPSHQPEHSVGGTPTSRPRESLSPEITVPTSLQLGTQHSQFQQISKEVAAMSLPRPIQKRTPWSERATGRLIKLIGMYGPAWSTIEKLKDPLLQGRDQGALKDKARNIKFDYLRAGHTNLPRNFDNVTLKTSQWEQIKDLRRRAASPV